MKRSRVVVVVGMGLGRSVGGSVSLSVSRSVFVGWGWRKLEAPEQKLCFKGSSKTDVYCESLSHVQFTLRQKSSVQASGPFREPFQIHLLRAIVLVRLFFFV